jgi:hypothetical protein
MSKTKPTSASILPPVKLPPAPKHLTAASRAWWTSVANEFPLTDTDYKVLDLAAGTLDVIENARKLLARDGMVFEVEGNLKQNPAALILRDNTALFSKLVKDLHLDGPQPGAPKAIGRPGGSARV